MPGQFLGQTVWLFVAHPSISGSNHDLVSVWCTFCWMTVAQILLNLYWKKIEYSRCYHGFWPLPYGRVILRIRTDVVVIVWISAYHHEHCEFESHSWKGAHDKTLYDLRKVGDFLCVIRLPQPIKLTTTT